jgi:outer membrane receptor protein involved in Fe transport
VLFLGVLLSQPAFAVIEEIVVTAQKREQNIQDVPISISAFSGEQLAEQSITDVFDLQQSAPGLIVQQNQTATTSNFSIRGVGTSGSNFGLESSVGLYVDGVYRARQNALVNELVDMDRVEVLRGPQGTLFGRNSPSGAVLMHTRAPEHEFGGYVDMDVGNLGLFSLNGAVGGTLVEDTLAYRLTGFTTDRDGYVDDVNLGSDEINDRNREGVRAQLLYTPNDVFTARIIADYAEVDEVCCAAVTVRNNYLVFPRNDLTGAFSPTPTFGTDAILGLPAIPVDTDFDMVPDLLIPGFGVSVVDQSRKFDDEVAYSVLPESQSTDRGLSAELNWDLDAGTITAISGWRQFDSDDLFDADFSTFELATRDEHAEQESFSQEIRFSSNFENGTYLVGVYYFQQTLDTESNIVLGSDANNFIALSVFQQAQLLSSLGLAAEAATASAVGSAIVGLNGFPSGQTARNLMEQDHRAWAVFGQVDWAFRENWELTFGLRYTKEKKELDGQFQEFGTSFGAGLGLSDLTIVNPRSDIDETLNDEQITGNIKLSWRPDDNRMYYISYATGYKSGGTNTDRILQAFEPFLMPKPRKPMKLVPGWTSPIKMCG